MSGAALEDACCQRSHLPVPKSSVFSTWANTDVNFSGPINPHRLGHNTPVDAIPHKAHYPVSRSPSPRSLDFGCPPGPPATGSRTAQRAEWSCAGRCHAPFVHQHLPAVPYQPRTIRKAFARRRMVLLMERPSPSRTDLPAPKLFNSVPVLRQVNE